MLRPLGFCSLCSASVFDETDGIFDCGHRRDEGARLLNPREFVRSAHNHDVDTPVGRLRHALAWTLSAYHDAIAGRSTPAVHVNAFADSVLLETAEQPDRPGDPLVCVPTSVLEALAPPEPMNQDEQGGCVWCAGEPAGQPGGYATSGPADHEADCPWVAARRLLPG